MSNIIELTFKFNDLSILNYGNSKNKNGKQK